MTRPASRMVLTTAGNPTSKCLGCPARVTNSPHCDACNAKVNERNRKRKAARRAAEKAAAEAQPDESLP